VDPCPVCARNEAIEEQGSSADDNVNTPPSPDEDNEDFTSVPGPPKDEDEARPGSRA